MPPDFSAGTVRVVPTRRSEGVPGNPRRGSCARRRAPGSSWEVDYPPAFAWDDWYAVRRPSIRIEESRPRSDLQRPYSIEGEVAPHRQAFDSPRRPRVSSRRSGEFGSDNLVICEIEPIDVYHGRMVASGSNRRRPAMRWREFQSFPPRIALECLRVYFTGQRYSWRLLAFDRYAAGRVSIATGSASHPHRLKRASLARRHGDHPSPLGPLSDGQRLTSLICDRPPTMPASPRSGLGPRVPDTVGRTRFLRRSPGPARTSRLRPLRRRHRPLLSVFREYSYCSICRRCALQHKIGADFKARTKSSPRSHARAASGDRSQTPLHPQVSVIQR